MSEQGGQDRNDPPADLGRGEARSDEEQPEAPRAEVRRNDVGNDEMAGEQLPGDRLPGDTVPGDPLPGDKVPGDTVPGDRGPGQESDRDEAPAWEAPTTAPYGNASAYSITAAFEPGGAGEASPPSVGSAEDSPQPQPVSWGPPPQVDPSQGAPPPPRADPYSQEPPPLGSAGGQPPYGNYGAAPTYAPYGAAPPGSYGAQPAYGYGQVRSTERNAVWALVLSIVAWVLCPVVPAIVALVLAGNAERAIADSGGMKEGTGMVKAARIISWVHLGLAVALVVFLVVGLLVAASVGTG